jgi:hypothetical protein
MKKLVTLLFLLITIIGSGQSVTAPDSKSFLPSTVGQTASGFVLSGFTTTSTLLASISLVNPPTGTTFYITTTTGLTAASGFTLAGNKTRLVVTGTMANINAALTSLRVNTGAVSGNVQLSVAATVNPTGFFYNGTNGHFYRPIAVGATYPNAKTLSAATTFKGQTGYLVTITSADEDAFIFTNVPQQSIWFALTDEAVEGQWRIDAGPEAGTLIKTSNGQLAGNIQGQYNNWAGGEPNNSGNEDYAVTKWGGGSQWNDLPANFSCAYVVEYGTWTNPDDATFTEFYTNSVTHTNGDVLTARFNIDFGSTVDKSKFTVRANTFTNNLWSTTTNTARAMSGLGKVDLTSDLDTNKIVGVGKKALTTAGEVEWAIIDVYSTNFGGHRLYIDSREFDGTGVSPSDVNSIKLFDIYEGAITYVQDAGGWRIFRIVPNISAKILSSAFQSSLRLQNGWYGTKAEFTFTQSTEFKPHGLSLVSTSQTDLNTLYANIVTVSDVFIAFKELSNRGILGNESGNEFTNGIQFLNADVDANGVFDEEDTYNLLRHLTGAESLTQSTTLSSLMKLYSKADYDATIKTNWTTRLNTTRSLLPFNLNTGTLNNNYNVSVTWLGDVNLSHSALPASAAVATSKYTSFSTSIPNQVNVYMLTELINDTVYATLNLDPLAQQVSGTQFKLNYDNEVLKYITTEFKTIGDITNFGVDKSTYVNLGSLVTNGNGVLDKKTEYKVAFTLKKKVANVLGLISISMTDAVNQSGKQLKVIVN